MNRNLFLMELRLQRTSFIAWAGSLCGLIFLGMAFYTVLSQNDFISKMDVLFEHPMMKGIMSAFNFDARRLSSISSFYITYASIYVLLMGCIYSAFTASKLIAREEEQKTAEFLLTKPLSRLEIFASKAAAFLVLLVILNAGVAAAGLAGMELFKTPASLTVHVPDGQKALMATAFRRNPVMFRNAFGLKSTDYLETLIPSVLPVQDGTKQIDPAVLEKLLKGMGDDPAAFLDRMAASPEEYGKLLNLEGNDLALFKDSLTQARQGLAAMTETLKTEPAKYVEIFEKKPERILTPFKNRQEDLARILSRFDLSPDTAKTLFVYYRLDNFFILAVYIFLLMAGMGSLGLLVSLSVRSGKSVTGIMLGLTFAFYFINTLTNISPAVQMLGYLSPFKFVNTDILNPAYGFQWWRLAYFAVLILGCGTASLVLFRKRDILV